MPAAASRFSRSGLKFRSTIVAKLHRLFGAGGLFAVITDESPGGLAFLNEQGNWEVFVANDLLVIEELDKAVVGDVLDILVTTVTNEQGHADEAKGNGDQERCRAS